MWPSQQPAEPIQRGQQARAWHTYSTSSYTARTKISAGNQSFGALNRAHSNELSNDSRVNQLGEGITRQRHRFTRDFELVYD